MTAEESGAPGVLVISGSRRPDNNTEKALRIALEELEKSARAEVVRVGDEWRFPLPGESGVPDDGERLRQKVLAADGLLFATPEYHGSISSTMKLIIDNLGFPSTLEGKTAAILGVAMGPSADNALGHLRHIITHVGGTVLPDAASIGSVHKKFDEAGNCIDPEAEEAIRQVVRGLLAQVGRG